MTSRGPASSLDHGIPHTVYFDLDLRYLHIKSVSQDAFRNEEITSLTTNPELLLELLVLYLQVAVAKSMHKDARVIR